MSETNSLTIFTRASEMLAQADTIQKAKELKNLALTAADWARRKNMGEEAVQHARSYAIEAMRRMGEMLRETELQQGARGIGKSGVERVDSTPTLKELGVSKYESQMAQRLVDVPREKLTCEIRSGKAVSRIVKDAKRENDKEQKMVDIKNAANKRVLPEHIRLLNGDFRNLEIADNSIDAIVTDPPYSKQYLPLYEALSVLADKWLKESGSLVAMVGQSTMPDILNIFSSTLEYQWTFAYILKGSPTQIKMPLINNNWKPVLWFTKGKKTHGCRSDVIVSEAPDKNFHEWGQSESGMDAIVKSFCKTGDTICDPFLGAGTTGVVVVRNKMKFIGSEIDANYFEIAENRIKAEI